MPYKSKEAHRTAKKRWYQRNKAHVQNKTWHQREIRANFVRSLRTPCAHCGFFHPAAMDFHHIDPAQKSFSISSAIKGRFPLEEIEAEVKKCLCLCKNCHAIHHANNPQIKPKNLDARHKKEIKCQSRWVTKERRRVSLKFRKAQSQGKNTSIKKTKEQYLHTEKTRQLQRDSIKLQIRQQLLDPELND